VNVRETALLVAALAACAGCLRRAGRADDAAPPVQYVRRSFQSSLAGCVDAATGAPAPCVWVDVEYVEPARATVELTRALARFLRATVLRPVADGPPPASVEALRDQLYDAYRTAVSASPDRGVRWQLVRRVTVACSTERVQGLVASERAMMDGAPGVDRVVYASFDTQTGDPIGLEALVAPEQRAQLLDELARRREGAAVTRDVWSRDRGAARAPGAAPDGFLVCPDAITARWSDGTEAALPRAELRGLLRADAP
jgi:hypothetical protein